MSLFKILYIGGLELCLQEELIRITIDLHLNLAFPSLKMRLCVYSRYISGVESLLVVNLGSIALTSVMSTAKDEVNVAQMHRAGTSDLEILKQLIAKSYDKFTIELNDLQVIYCCSSSFTLCVVKFLRQLNSCRVS